MKDRVLARITYIPGIRTLWTRVPIGSVEVRVKYGIWNRPGYAYGVYAAADLANRLKLDAMTVIEFGVAGGRGLLELEHIAAKVSRSVGIQIVVLGFDSGDGMPDPVDYRDVPYVWGRGFYRMDQDRLKRKLRTAKLVLGDVAETVPDFLKAGHIPPIGFIAFDLDYYSSTKKALSVFDSDEDRRLPRVYCYFDDIMWPETACHNEFVGELCAIREFNCEHNHKKLCPLHMLRYMRVHPAAWNEQVYVMHDFEHPLYSTNVTPPQDEYTQLRL